ncbi:MAG: peptide chain release factor N(5)-glutamine methyltransferase [Eggerthellaceae bacterium]|nr:peptide chain release factor N(5)-glutamine methyltransferase [Eggerthellaceae bacterium]
MIGQPNIRDCQQIALNILGSTKKKKYQPEVILMLEYATGITVSRQPIEYDHILEGNEYKKFFDAVDQRKAGRPLQYIIGNAPFRKLELHVEEGVLIPRPETEILVEEALEALKSSKKIDAQGSCRKEMKILEIGCGSGCISCSMAYEIPDAKITATDINPKAIKITKMNAKKYGLENRIELVEADMFPQAETKYDLIISNPPYVPRTIYENLDTEVKKFEPSEALVSGEDGLYFFCKFIEHAPSYLYDGGIIALELFEDSLTSAKKIVENVGFQNCKIKKDLNNKNRIIIATLEEKI